MLGLILDEFVPDGSSPVVIHFSMWVFWFVIRDSDAGCLLPEASVGRSRILGFKFSLDFEVPFRCMLAVGGMRAFKCYVLIVPTVLFGVYVFCFPVSRFGSGELLTQILTSRETLYPCSR